MICFNVPPFTGKELEYMKEAIEAQKICGDGQFTKKCNQWLEEKTGTKKALLTTSCTHATELAALLADVKPGDEVKVGQVIAEAGGFVSVPVHASVSGKVKKIEDILMSGGQMVPSIIIESDGLQELCEGIKPPEVTDMQSFIDAVRASGVVGLGGAGFPTAVKLSVKDLSLIEAVIYDS